MRNIHQFKPLALILYYMLDLNISLYNLLLPEIDVLNTSYGCGGMNTGEIHSLLRVKKNVFKKTTKRDLIHPKLSHAIFK